MVYDTLNPEIVHFIIQDKREKLRILDVGCATGRLGNTLKARSSCWISGIEFDTEAAECARRHYDEVVVMDLETLSSSTAWPGRAKAFDIVVFGDILEHLTHPERVLRYFHAFVSDGGFVIASIPNVANWLLRASLFLGRFDYNGGILDETHMRFFTYRTARRILEENGYRIIAVRNNNQTAVIRLLGRIWMRLFAFQFVFKCVKTP